MAVDLYELQFPKLKRKRKTVQGVRDFHNGKISSGELVILLRDGLNYSTFDYGLDEYIQLVNRATCTYLDMDYYSPHYISELIANSASYKPGNAHKTDPDAARKKWKEIESLFLLHFRFSKHV